MNYDRLTVFFLFAMPNNVKFAMEQHLTVGVYE